jgi:ATP-binding cassette subfamily B protein
MKKGLFYNIYLLKIMLKTSPLRVVYSLLLILFDVALTFVSTVTYIKYLLDAITSNGSFRSVVIFSALLMLISLVNNLLHTILSNRIEPVSNVNIQKVAQSMMYEKVSGIDLSCFDNPAFFNDYVIAFREFDGRIMATWETFENFFRSILTAALMVGYISAQEPIIILFSVVPLIFSLIIGIISNKIMFKLNLEITPITRQTAYVRRVFYLQQYAKELHTSGIGGVMLKGVLGAFEHWKKIFREYTAKRVTLSFLPTVISSIFGTIGTSVYMFYKIMVRRAMTVGGFMGVLTAVANFTGALGGIFDIIPKLNENALYAKKVFDLLNYENTVKSGDAPMPPVSEDFVLELKNVSFRYTENDDYDLRNVNMRLRRGEKIAIVGENGAGKTTLVKLLYRFYDPTEGEILLNGQDIRTLDLEEYRAIFNAVFQDFQVYATTVAENVLMRPFDNSDEETVLRSLTESRLELGNIQAILTREFDEQGVVLSGGQTQKLAIARVFANTGRDIIILDEPSSALDPVSEYYIIKQINEKFADKSIVFISHRLSTTRDVDHIYLLDGGQVIEDGSHGELMARNGIYADMFSKQAEKFRDDATPL